MRSFVAWSVVSLTLGFTTGSWLAASEREDRLIAAIETLRAHSTAVAVGHRASEDCKPAHAVDGAAPVASASSNSKAVSASAEPADDSQLDVSADAFEEAEVLVTEATREGTWSESHVQRFRTLIAQMIPEDARAAVQRLSAALNAQRMRLEGPTPF